MAEKLTELHGGTARFTAIGVASITPETFKGASAKEDSFWKSVNSTIALNIKDGEVAYPQLRDGYMTNNPVLKRPRANRKDGDDYLIEIPFAERLAQEHIESVAPHSLFKTNIAKNADGVTDVALDQEGKTVLKQFISGVDFEEYLSENLVDGTPIKVIGNVNYSLSKDGEKVYRNFEINSVYLNRPYMKNGEEIAAAPHSMTIEQTYLVDVDSLDKKWEKELEADGQTIVRCFVPQYMSKMWDGKKYATVKKTVAIPSSFMIKADATNPEAVQARKNVVKLLFNVGKKEGVREVTVVNTIKEGYETGAANMVITKELQDLLDMGGITMDQIKAQTVVRGTRVSETVFRNPCVITDDSGMRPHITIGKYEESVLAMPQFDGEDSVSKESPATTVGMSDNDFNAMFGLTGDASIPTTSIDISDDDLPF